MVRIELAPDILNDPDRIIDHLGTHEVNDITDRVA
ncbi:hypothetical protein VVAX_05927 [Variovorax paradoxus]|jgi:hypothetical protein|uniref:Uncharacterized protein n=1 Tax=Variovorax paradoxus TaxID=34073 RepID=A0A679JE09_VARPD|nr:hypothetical protein VVAX_05927 [Variovorax paradoxus]